MNVYKVQLVFEEEEGGGGIRAPYPHKICYCMHYMTA